MDISKQIIPSNNTTLILKKARKIIPYTKTSPSNDTANKATLKRYGLVTKSLAKFCIAVEDFKSNMVASHEQSPFGSYPVNLNTAQNFLRYKCLPAGQVLNDIDTDLPMYFKHGSLAGQPIKSTQAWESFLYMEIYGAALTKIH